jgi:EAL domain-containing protein (putative c-di-GMP-specific phosphodiesterase class I)
VRVAVNTSAFQLRQSDFDRRMLDILSECEVTPDQFELELTETAMMQSVERTSDTLLALNRAGLLLTIDDFGTGYSSLSYLKRFEIDKLKIDRSFVRDVPADPNDAAIAATIIAMGHALSLRVLAEGVETQAQLDFLRGQGCDEAQGYLLGRPLPADEVPDLLAAERLRGVVD